VRKRRWSKRHCKMETPVVDATRGSASLWQCGKTLCADFAALCALQRGCIVCALAANFKDIWLIFNTPLTANYFIVMVQDEQLFQVQSKAFLSF
jgi:hypothetical protein